MLAYSKEFTAIRSLNRPVSKEDTDFLFAELGALDDFSGNEYIRQVVKSVVKI